jgi:hypothetical protein
LIVSADAVLALTVAYQRLKTVPSQCGKVPQRSSRFDTVELQARGSFKSRECLDPFPGGEFSGPLVPIADDRYSKIPGSTRYVKRKGPKQYEAHKLDSASHPRQAEIPDSHQTAINGPKSKQTQANGLSRQRRLSN